MRAVRRAASRARMSARPFDARGQFRIAVQALCCGLCFSRTRLYQLRSITASSRFRDFFAD